MTLYPLPLLVFGAVCAYLIYSCVTYAWAFKRLSLFVLLGVIAVGVLIYLLSPKPRKTAR